jgi:hypothetical protein
MRLMTLSGFSGRLWGLFDRVASGFCWTEAGGLVVNRGVRTAPFCEGAVAAR